MFKKFFEEKVPKALQMPLLIGVTLVALYFVYQAVFPSNTSNQQLTPKQAQAKFEEMVNKLKQRGASQNKQLPTQSNR